MHHITPFWDEKFINFLGRGPPPSTPTAPLLWRLRRSTCDPPCSSGVDAHVWLPSSSSVGARVCVCRVVQQDAGEYDGRRARRISVLQVVPRQEVRTEGIRLRTGRRRAQHRRCRVRICTVTIRAQLLHQGVLLAGSVTEWLACWTRAQKDPGSNRSRDAVG